MRQICSTATWAARAGAVSLSLCATGALAQGADSYSRAVEQLESGQTQTAVTLLESVVQQNPRHAGARLDLVLGYCALGQLSSAQEHYTALEQFPGVPLALLKVAQAALATGCTGREPGERVWAMAGLAIGHTSNVNAGPSQSRVWFAQGAPIDFLDFTQDSMPRSDWLKTFSAGVGYSRWALQGEFRKHHHASAYDAVQLQLSGGGSAQGVGSFQDARWGAQMGAWWQRKGSREHALGLSYEAWQLEPRATARYGVGAKAVMLDYPREPKYGSVRLELGPRLAFRWSQTRLLGSSEATYDHTVSDRPGGDRLGLQLGIEASRPWLGGQLQANLMLQAQHDREPFNTIFFGRLRREARRVYATATQIWLIDPIAGINSRLSAYIRFTSDRTSDNTGLYSTQANQWLIGIRGGF